MGTRPSVSCSRLTHRQRRRPRQPQRPRRPRRPLRPRQPQRLLHLHCLQRKRARARRSPPRRRGLRRRPMFRMRTLGRTPTRYARYAKTRSVRPPCGSHAATTFARRALTRCAHTGSLRRAPTAVRHCRRGRRISTGRRVSDGCASTPSCSGRASRGRRCRNACATSGSRWWNALKKLQILDLTMLRMTWAPFTIKTAATATARIILRVTTPSWDSNTSNSLRRRGTG
mmetsp:Transcript_90166/g.257829  ORF Transcript_90166/g.257829 Transcript_90166/m.257829 type:complete len:228 (+) Transcript_90166:358-1041(+)